MAGASFLGALTGVALGPFLPTIARDMDVPVPLLGQVAAGTLLLAAVLGIFVGPLADRYGRRRLLLVGLAAVAACGCATASARAYPALLGAQALGAVAVASLEGVSLAEAGSRFAGPARRRAMGAITGAIASSSVVGVPMLAAIGGSVGWRWAFVALGAGGLGGACLTARSLPRDGDPGAEAPRRWPGTRELLSAYWPLARHRRARALLAASFLRAFFWMGAVLYLGALFADVHGLGTREVGLVYFASGAGYLAGSAAAGAWPGGPGPRASYATTTVACGALFGLAFLSPLGTTAAVACVALASFLGPFGWVVLAAMLSAETPAGQATTMVLAVSIYSLGAAAGGAAGGAVLALGGYPALGLALMLAAAAAVVPVWRRGRWTGAVP